MVAMTACCVQCNSASSDVCPAQHSLLADWLSQWLVFCCCVVSTFYIGRISEELKVQT